MEHSSFFELLSNDLFFAAASVLVLGYIFSRLIKLIKLPRVTGYLLSGILFGPYVFKIININTMNQLDFIPRFALGVIALVIGSGLSFKLIKRLGMGLIIITILQAVGAFFAVFFLLLLFKVPLGAILPLAAIATATAPAATVAIIQEYRARGPFTETILAVVALDDAIAIILFGVVLSLDIQHLSTFGSSVFQAISASLFEISSALVIGFLLGILAHYLIKFTKDVSDSVIVILGIVFMAIAVATVSHTSALLTNMFLGMTLINISNKNSEMVVGMEKLVPPIYCFFFVLAGAHLNIPVFVAAGATLFIWSGAFVSGRMIGKISGAYLGGAFSGASETIKKYLGLTLIPQAGVAIGLSLLIVKGSPYFEYKSIILNITLITVAFNELIGPLFTKYALFKANEATVEE